jgi:hypothetical protein
VQKIKKKKIMWVNEYDLKWIKEIARILLNKNIDNLSSSQISLLRELYLENLRDGLKPKEAMVKAFHIVNCFKT